MTVNNLLTELTGAEISEWMAFDQLKEESYKERLSAEMLSDEQRMLKIKSLFGYKPDGNNW